MMRWTFTGLAAVLATSTFAADTGPRVRENFNQGWLFARQTNGSGELGSFDRDTAQAARIERVSGTRPNRDMTIRHGKKSLCRILGTRTM